MGNHQGIVATAFACVVFVSTATGNAGDGNGPAGGIDRVRQPVIACRPRSCDSPSEPHSTRAHPRERRNSVDQQWLNPLPDLLIPLELARRLV